MIAKTIRLSLYLALVCFSGVLWMTAGIPPYGAIPALIALTFIMYKDNDFSRKIKN